MQTRRAPGVFAERKAVTESRLEEQCRRFVSWRAPSLPQPPSF
jgi:hypothetical protein